MAEVTLEHIWKRYGKVDVVKDINLHIHDAEFIVLVGPSGCGKSTTLRMIAGLEDISEGTLRIGGVVMNAIPPKDRDIAMVFQNYALYPHMTVANNMAFALKLRGTPKAEIRQRVNAAAETLQIHDLLQRRPEELSGGQRQRVALGRAIVREPKVFLMDEPLSNLDAKLRLEMRASIAKLHQRLGVTTVYVTHDQVEAMTMGSRIVVMRDGIVQQIDAPLALYDKPCNVFVAEFMGSPAMNIIRAQFDGNMVRNAALDLHLEGELASIVADYPHSQGDAIDVGIRPEDIGIRGMTDIPERGTHRLHATVEVVEPLGAETTIVASLEGARRLVARVDAHSHVKVGERLEFLINTDKVHLFDPHSGRNLRYG